MIHRRHLHAADLVAVHPGLSEAGAAALVEAVRVCLDRRYRSPTQFRLTDRGRGDDALDLVWDAADDRAHAFWSDPPRTTEWAAEGVAIVAVEAARDLVVVSRAARGSGLDYYIGQAGDDLENVIGLEIAGIDRGSLPALLAREREQARGNPAGLAAIAAVVRFEVPHVMMDDA